MKDFVHGSDEVWASELLSVVIVSSTNLLGDLFQQPSETCSRFRVKWLAESGEALLLVADCFQQLMLNHLARNVIAV